MVLDHGVFDTDDFSGVAPNVVVSTITWFGRHGPYADFQGTSGVCWSLAGMVRPVGPAAGPPLLAAGCGAEVVGGLAAYIGTLGQVIAREIGNADGAVRLDTSIFEANLCFTEPGGVGGYRQRFGGDSAWASTVSRPPTRSASMPVRTAGSASPRSRPVSGRTSARCWTCANTRTRRPTKPLLAGCTTTTCWSRSSNGRCGT